MKFEIKAEIPDGYEPTGEFRKGEIAEFRLWKGMAILVTFRTNFEYVILRKIETWRPMVVADLQNGPVQARVWRVLFGDWLYTTVIGCRWLGENVCWLGVDGMFKEKAEVRCEV